MDSTAQTCEKLAEPSPDLPGPTDCVGAFETDDGYVVIYEEHQGTGWIRSDTAVALADYR